jgi:glycerophosphoryl diester phosphodiesterase
MALGQQKWVIAHRGASGYLPENTLPAFAMAHGLGCDWLELDVILSQDDQPIVLHDAYLDRLTDVNQRFPGRQRKDNLSYALDFSLEELAHLRVSERCDQQKNPAFPGRFPQGHSRFAIPTLEEVVQLIQGLNHSTGKKVGLLIEIKSPRWHQQQGRDLSQKVLEVLEHLSVNDNNCPIILESFDAPEVKRLRYELKTKFPLLQLLEKNSWQENEETDYEFLLTKSGLQTLSEHVQGIAVWTGHVLEGRYLSGMPKLSSLVKDAHELGLKVYAYTLRADALPTYIQSFEEMLHIFYCQADVDGIITDFPDCANKYLRTLEYHQLP